MKERDDELKDFFSQQPPEENFEFDQQNWEKFHADLKKKRKDKKRVLIYLNLLLLLIGTTVLYFVLAEPNQTETINNSKKETTYLQPKKPVNQPSSTLSDNSTVQHQENILQAIEPGRSPIKLRSEKDPAQSAESHLNPTKKTNQAAINPGTPETAVSRAETPEKVAGQAAVFSKQKKREPAAKTEVKEQGKFSMTMSKRAPVNEMQKAETQNPVETTEKTVKQEPEKEPSSPQKNSDTTLDRLVDQTDQVKPDPLQEIPVGETTTSITTEPPLTIAKKDSTTGPAAPAKDSLPGKKPLRNMLLLELGTDYLAGWKNNDKTEAAGFNPVFGFNYVNTVTPKLALSAGIQYRSIGNFNGTAYTATTSVLKFGEESKITTISPTRVHYLAVPLKVYYVLNSKNAFGLGYTLGHLLNVESKVEEYEKRQGYQSETSVSKSLGYKSGFSDLDGQITFCYRRRIFTRLYLNGELFYGTSDIKNNLIYRSTLFERSMGLKLSLSFNFFKNN